jgi:hypothetical protein
MDCTHQARFHPFPAQSTYYLSPPQHTKKVRLRELLFRGDLDTDLSQLQKIFHVLGRWVVGWMLTHLTGLAAKTNFSCGQSCWLLFPYRSPDKLTPINAIVGTPTEANWPGFTALPDYPR